MLPGTQGEPRRSPMSDSPDTRRAHISNARWRSIEETGPSPKIPHATRRPSRGRSGAVVPGVVLLVLRVRTELGDSGIRLPRSAPSESNPRLRSQRCSAACPGPRGRAGLASLSMQLELPWDAARATCLPGPTWRGIRGWRRRRLPAGEGAPGDRRQGFPRSGRWEAVPPSARRSPGKALCSSGRGSRGWGT